MSNAETLRRIERIRQARSGGATSEVLTPVAGLTPPPLEIGEGQVAYSTVFGASASGRDYAVPMFSQEDWPEEARHYIPSKIMGYVFPPAQTERLVAALFGLNARAGLIHGPKGSGKSSLPEQVCAFLNIPFFRVNMSQDAESGRLFGGVDVLPEGGGLGWVPGAVEMAATCGGRGAILQVDEVSASPPGINLAMQWMLERGGQIFLDQKPQRCGDQLIKPGEMFRVVCTDNTALQGDTTGKYVGTNVQNEAFLDRMAYTIELGYMEAAHEVSIITNRIKEFPKGVAEQMVRIAGMIRASYDASETQLTMSPRGLLDWAEQAMFFGSLSEAFRSVFFDKLIPEDKAPINEIYRTVTGTAL